MGKPQRKKRTHKNIKDFKKKLRTRKRTKDIDQVHQELKLKSISAQDSILHQKLDPDLPGEGQFYCLICTRHFMDGKTLTEHKKTKNHKKRLRLMKETPYSYAEAELAAGMGSYTIKPNKKPIGNKTSYNEESLLSQQSVADTTHVMGDLNIDAL